MSPVEFSTLLAGWCEKHHFSNQRVCRRTGRFLRHALRMVVASAGPAVPPDEGGGAEADARGLRAAC